MVLHHHGYQNKTTRVNFNLMFIFLPIILTLSLAQNSHWLHKKLMCGTTVWYWRENKYSFYLTPVLTVSLLDISFLKATEAPKQGKKIAKENRTLFAEISLSPFSISLQKILRFSNTLATHWIFFHKSSDLTTTFESQRIK